MLTPAQVIPFLDHDDPEVRAQALRYLAGAHDPAPATADDLWRAIDRLGGVGKARDVVTRLAALPQTPDSISRTLAALKEHRVEDKQDEEDEEEADFDRESLLQALEAVEFDVLSARGDDLTTSEEIPDDLRQQFGRRLSLANEPVESLWDGLMELARRCGDDTLSREAEREADALVEALARRPGEFADAALAVLRDDSVKDWREIFALAAVGRTRGIAGVADILTDRLGAEDDFVCELATDGLVRMGDSELVARLADRFAKESFAWQLYASEVLSRIKRPESEVALLRLLAQSTDPAIVGTLAGALCDLCPTEPAALETLRGRVIEGGYDRTIIHLDETLLATGAIVGYVPPEAPQWRRQISEARARWATGMSDVDGFLNVPPAGWSENSMLVGGPLVQSPPSRPRAAPLAAGAARRPAQRPAVTATAPAARATPRKVGRNDPCPCGSGKKYKKCCLTR